MWRIAKICVSDNKIIIAQAANTGLTGGSTPAPHGYDRDAVIISMLHLCRSHVINGGVQVICLPGVTLHQLERTLESYQREPHSVIGSSCIGATVVGGVCNNSGGASVRRGPAYTEMALFARVSESGELELINQLSVRLGDSAENVLSRLEAGQFGEADIDHPSDLLASDRDYATRVRQIELDEPLRFNADARRLYGASGSAGRVVVFAVRLDTFPKDALSQVFYVGPTVRMS